MIDPLDYPYSIYKSSDGDALLDAHNDIIAVFDPHTEPEIERMVAAAPEMAALLEAAYHELTCVTYVLPRGNTHDHAESLRLKIAALICRVFDGEESAE